MLLNNFNFHFYEFINQLSMATGVQMPITRLELAKDVFDKLGHEVANRLRLIPGNEEIQKKKIMR